jgi:SAM-dependent methyltransferase
MNTYEFCAGWVAEQAGGRPVRVLDYGCGSGQIVALIRAKNIDAHGCDVFYDGGNYSNTSAEVAPHLKRMEGNRIPFDDASFDLVLSNQVMEHVPDLNIVVAEIHRVLKPGGRTLHLFPDRGVWREGHCGVPFLHRFPKHSQLRVYYAALARMLGLGSFKEGKPVMQWSRDFCTWLDQWTHYRSQAEIHATFARSFADIGHIEERWLEARMGRRIAIPVTLQRFLVRKLGGLAIVARKRSDRDVTK